MQAKDKTDKSKLRSGYTTGACAAASSKAAALLLLQSLTGSDSEYHDVHDSHDIRGIKEAEIPFPDGSRVTFAIHDSGVESACAPGSDLPSCRSAWASVIKDAGDDPDITNRAEIRAEVTLTESAIAPVGSIAIVIKGGNGVGVVTKPGLAVPVGEPAINPVPRKMITDAVAEALCEHNEALALLSESSGIGFTVTISVARGEKLARKTLNKRLGIVGGLSILGTTGIVRPISAEAWTATITASMDVAKAMNQDTIVLSSGRTSEKAHQKRFDYSEDCYAMMGDYLEFSLLEAKRHQFNRIYISAQWAKLIKAAMSIPQTHVRHGVVDPAEASGYLRRIGVNMPDERQFNTVREIYGYLLGLSSLSSDCIGNSDNSIENNSLENSSDINSCSGSQTDAQKVFTAVCCAAKSYAEEVSGGIPVTVCLVSYEGEIIAQSE